MKKIPDGKEFCDMIKAKFGGRLRSKNKIAQMSELLAKVLCHNICVVIQEMHELGIRRSNTLNNIRIFLLLNINLPH